MTAVDAAKIVTTLNSTLDLVEVLIPVVQGLAKEGLVTPEEQAAQLARIDAIRSGDAFKGPEWQKSTS